MMKPEFMPDLKKEVLEDLIKYLRGLEMKGMGSKEEKGEPMDMGLPEKGEEEDGLDMEKLEEPDLDMEEEKEEDPGLTETQAKIKDFFNNVRPRTGSSLKKGRILFASESKPSGGGKGSRLMGKGK